LGVRATTLAISALRVEPASFGLTRLRPDLVDDREAALAEVRTVDFGRFKATAASNLLGWNDPTSTTPSAKKIVRERLLPISTAASA